jgi:hypothetical protein
MLKSIAISFICLGFLFHSCTKEVQIDIPGYEPQVVVDGRIETGGYPIVLLSRSQDLYSPALLSAYVESFITDASVSVSDGTTTVTLDYVAVSSLPIESQKTVAEMLRAELSDVQAVPLYVYSTTNPAMIGAVGKTYTLTIIDQGKTLSGSTTLAPPVSLDSLSWMPKSVDSLYGSCKAKLTDPVGQSNAYKWEMKVITETGNGPKDNIFRSSSSPYFSDQFFDGLTLEFETLYAVKDTTYPSGFKRHFKLNDAVVIKMSRVDDAVYSYYERREAQKGSNGNPFATPVNIPCNISGALGIWAGISPWYDTLNCVP